MIVRIKTIDFPYRRRPAMVGAMSDLELADVMSIRPLTVAPPTSLADAAGAMLELDVGAAVVVDRGRVVGIVTERDLARATAVGAAPTDAPVERWMSRAPLTMPPGADVLEALEAMLARGFRHIPVVDGGRLGGLVSLRRLVAAARLRKVDPWSPGTAKGLANVTVAEPALSHIDGEAGRLVFRGYDAVELARGRSFEDVWHLLYTGELPADGAFARRTAALRAAPLDRATLAALAARSDGFMATVQAAIAATGAAWGVRPWHERDPREAEAWAVRATSVVPTLVAALWRLRQGLEPIEPDPALGHAANYLWMLEGRRPAADRTLAVERYLVL